MKTDVRDAVMRSVEVRDMSVFQRVQDTVWRNIGFLADDSVFWRVGRAVDDLLRVR